MNNLKAWLVRACNELKLRVETDFVWESSQGDVLYPVVRIPDIGGENGMLIFQNSGEVSAHVDELIQREYGFSTLSQPLPNEQFDLEGFREMFADWGRDVNE